MPIYELAVVLRILPRADVAAALKRVGCLLIEKGAQLQKIENLGLKELPFRFTVKDETHYQGRYFVYSFAGNWKMFPEVLDACCRDVDVIRHKINPSVSAEVTPCTLEEEMRPPATRQSVQDLMQRSRKNKDRSKPFYWHVKEYSYEDVYK